MVPSLDDYFHKKDLEHHLFPSRDNDDQKTTNQPLKVVSYATFPSGLKRCRKLRH